MWHTLENVKRSESGTITSEMSIPAGSAWFEGHFPGHPILPGVALLGMVEDAVAAVEENARIFEIGRVRFKKQVGPEEVLHLTIHPKPEERNAYRFVITAGNETICTGTVGVSTRTGSI